MKHNKTYIIAEAGVNHNGSLSIAKELVDVAVNARADAIKFQSFNTEKLVTKEVAKAAYQEVNDPRAKNQFDMLKELELSCEDQCELADYARDKKIDFMSTAFDKQSLQFLAEKLKVSQFKIGSGEMTNLPFLWEHARYNKNIILSTGMSTLDEIALALSVIALGFCDSRDSKPTLEKASLCFSSKEGRDILKKKVILLHCTSDYPAKIDDIHLNAMSTMAERFDLKVGYSDHSLGLLVPIVAISKGACIIEKHITLNKNMDGPDHRASLEPNELDEMVRQIRDVERILGDSLKKPTFSEMKTLEVARRSLVASTYIAKGDIFTENNVLAKRSGVGLSPVHYWELMGKRAQKEYACDELIEDLK